MANYILLILVVIVALVAGVGIFIVIQMRRNRETFQLQERAIANELELAKKEGVEIPDDLEKRLERF